jgi:hypothetical protein
METEQFIIEVEEHLGVGDIRGATDIFYTHFSHLSDLEASRQISTVLYKQYTNYRSGFLAMLLEGIIRKNPNLAHVGYPENFLFKLCVILGSRDFYECFIEEAVEPLLKDKSKYEKEEYYTDLYITTEKLVDHLFTGYAPCLKGKDYNGAYSTLEDNVNVVIIHKEDYDIMEKVMEDYNRIIGKRNIISDLTKKINSDD